MPDLPVPTPDGADAAYTPPKITVLGSLAELTLGGTDLSNADGWGGAGDSGNAGSLPTA